MSTWNRAFPLRTFALRRGFTLVELLVVLSIIALLIALLLPALKSARATAHQAACMSNLRQAGIAMTNYSLESDGTFVRPSYGRSNDGLYKASNSIASNHPLGPPGPSHTGYPSDMHVGIHNHGSWLIYGYTDPDIFLCPGLTYEHIPSNMNADPQSLAGRLTFYKRWEQYFNTAGMHGSTPGRWLMNPTSYTINAPLAGWGRLHVGAKNDGVPWVGVYKFGEPVTLEQMQSSWPVLADHRGGNQSGGRSWAHHDSRGFNVLRVDGAVMWVSSDAVIDTAVNSTVIGNGRDHMYEGFANIGGVPPTPKDDHASGVGGGDNPFVYNHNASIFHVFHAVMTKR
ncbi:MAG: type II secretion system protein [bacterium]